MSDQALSGQSVGLRQSPLLTHRGYEGYSLAILGVITILAMMQLLRRNAYVKVQLRASEAHDRFRSIVSFGVRSVLQLLHTIALVILRSREVYGGHARGLPLSLLPACVECAKS